MLITGAFAQDTPDTAAPTMSGTTTDDGSGGGGHAGGVLKRLTYTLGLTGSQQAEIAPIIEAAKPQLKAIREQAKTATDGVIDHVASQITPLLTGTQQAKFAEMVQQLEESPGPGGPGGPEGPGPGHSGKQPAGGGGGRFGGQEQLQHLTAALSLTPQQKFAQVKDVLVAANGQIDGILTPKQQAAFAALKQEMRHGRRPGGVPAASPSPSA